MTFRARLAARRPLGLALAAALSTVLVLTGCSAGPSSEAAAKDATTADAGTSATLAAATGSVTGGASVTIKGDGLEKVASVSFGGAVAPVAKASNGQKVVVKSPAAANYQPASVKVTLLDKAGKPVAAVAKPYTYTAQTPVAKQLAYALSHWKNYNTAEYGDLNSVGGDCANFVSQTLIARGWKMNDTWYNHDAAASWSPQWGYVPAMDDYFAANAKTLGLVRLSSDQRDKVALGDIGIFDWEGDGDRDHVEVVTAINHVDGKITIEFASHNDDYDYRDLDTTLTVQHPGGAMHFWHLTK